nr:EOG090X0GMQ [Ilyocryptus agilis]
MATAPVARGFISVLARCMPSDLKNAVKFKIKHVEFDARLNMHFAKHETVYAHDPDAKCKPGDIVLIHKLPRKLTKFVTHEVDKVVYPLGDVTDPITGKKVVVGKYRDEIEARNALYGKNPEGFDYNNAPERGWQKDKRDFSYRETYRKYHMFEEEDPYAIN